IARRTPFAQKSPQTCRGLTPQGAFEGMGIMRLFRSAGWLVALVMALGVSPVSAAERSVEALPDTDLPGFDYRVIEDVTLQACQSACVDDRICRAFTYNSKAKWCFLKAGAGEPVSFAGATSGTIKQSPMP